MEPLTGRTPRDQNRIPATFGVSSADGVTTVPLEVNPATGRLLVDSTGGGSGSNVTITSPIGQTTKSASVSVTLASDQGTLAVNDSSAEASLGSILANQTNSTQLTKVTDGTNVTNVQTGDLNGLIVNNNTKTIAFTSSGTGAQMLLPNTDVRGYGSIRVVWTSVGTGLAATGQFSPNSGGTYVNPQTWSNRGSSIGIPASLGLSINVVYESPVISDFFQINITTLTGGTASGYVILSTLPTPYHTMAIASNSSTSSAVPSNAFYAGFNARSASPTAVGNGQLVGALSDLMGIQLTSTGGINTQTIAAGTAANTVIKNSAGRICRLLVTATGTAAMNIYDNATTNSGTIIGAVPASGTVGTTYDFNLPAANGITIGGNSLNPGVTVSWI